MKNTFYSLANAFMSDKNKLYIWRNTFFVVPRFLWDGFFSVQNRSSSEEKSFWKVHFWNGFHQNENAFFDFLSRNTLEWILRTDELVLLIVECFLVNSKISFKNAEHLLVRFITHIKLYRYIEKEYRLAPNGFVSVLKYIKFFLIVFCIKNYHHNS